jgi:RNAse (barnase) inhibitor barstar
MEHRMREVTLDGKNWRTQDDVYDAIFAALQSPEWHGRNFSALRDSIAGGDVNGIDPPYHLIILNYDQIAGQARRMADDFIDLVREIAVGGCPVDIAVHNSDGSVLP